MIVYKIVTSKFLCSRPGRLFTHAGNSDRRGSGSPRRTDSRAHRGMCRRQLRNLGGPGRQRVPCRRLMKVVDQLAIPLAWHIRESEDAHLLRGFGSGTRRCSKLVSGISKSLPALRAARGTLRDGSASPSMPKVDHRDGKDRRKKARVVAREGRRTDQIATPSRALLHPSHRPDASHDSLKTHRHSNQQPQSHSL